MYHNILIGIKLYQTTVICISQDQVFAWGYGATSRRAK
jgi:hypothetical protein